MAGKYKVQLKQADGTMADLPLVATYDSGGNKIADTYVPKVSGKGLSTNDYTTTEKNKLGKAVTTDGTQTITGAKTFNAAVTMSSGKTLTFDYTTKQSDAGSIKWKASNSKNPYIGYCTSSTDGTFMLGSLAGTTYTTGLSIGGSSGNLLWKGNRVVTTADTATTSSAGVMSATDKTKLNGLSNYSLPTATSSVLGGVKTGSNITNSSGTISISKTNVTNALGYEPASPTDLENKADVYTFEGTTTTSKKLSEIKVGDNLSGVTLVFSGTPVLPSTTYKINFGNQSASHCIIYKKGSSNTATGLAYIEYGYSTSALFGVLTYAQKFIDANGQSTENIWSVSSYTFPTVTDNSFVVTSISGTLSEAVNIANTTMQLSTIGEVSVDCAYNYNEIQALKTDVEALEEQVNNSSGGAIYRHTISFGHSGPYAMDAITVYSSSSESVGQSSQAFELLGTGWYATYMSSMYGEGMIIAKMTDSITLSFKGAVNGTDTITAVYDTVTQV